MTPNPMLKMFADQQFGPVRPELYGAPVVSRNPTHIAGAPLPTGPGQSMTPFGAEWLLRKTTDGDGL